MHTICAEGFALKVLSFLWYLNITNGKGCCLLLTTIYIIETRENDFSPMRQCVAKLVKNFFLMKFLAIIYIIDKFLVHLQEAPHYIAVLRQAWFTVEQKNMKLALSCIYLVSILIQYSGTSNKGHSLLRMLYKKKTLYIKDKIFCPKN